MKNHLSLRLLVKLAHTLVSWDAISTVTQTEIRDTSIISRNLYPV